MIKFNRNDFEIREFSDGGLILSCGDKVMDNDLVFAGGAMDERDPLLQEQREILNFLMLVINEHFDKESK